MIKKCTVCEQEFELIDTITIPHGSDISVCPVCRKVDELQLLRARIEVYYAHYQSLQDQYRKLTGRQHEWLR